MAQMNMIEAIRSAHDVMMERDSSVVVLGEDVGIDGGVFRAARRAGRRHRGLGQRLRSMHAARPGGGAGHGQVLGSRSTCGLSSPRPVDRIERSLDALKAEIGPFFPRAGGPFPLQKIPGAAVRARPLDISSKRCGDQSSMP